MEPFTKELRKELQLGRRILTGISSILITADEDKQITNWNIAAEKAFGIRAEDARGRSLGECGARWDWEKIAPAISKVLAEGAPVRVDDIAFTRTDGRDGFISLTITAMEGDSSERMAFLLLGEDVTERRILEGQLSQAQKLESIGQLAAGIAHEINTPLQFIGDNTRFLQEAFDDLMALMETHEKLVEAARSGQVSGDLIKEAEERAEQAGLDYLQEEVPRAIRDSLDGFESVSRIVLAMKDFSHPGSDEKEPVDINGAIESTLTVARNAWKHVTEIETDFDPSLPEVECLPGEMNQVFLNILINAVHAITDVVGHRTGQKGAIRITTRADGDRVEIRMADSGKGIPREIRTRIFDPFFTTKGVGKGTGQGLAIAHSVVVDKHGGTIAVESEEGKGTTFIIRLPKGDAS